MYIPLGQLAFYDEKTYYVGSAIRYTPIAGEQYEVWKSLFLDEDSIKDNPDKMILVEQLAQSKLVYTPAWTKEAEERQLYIRSIINYDLIREDPLSQLIAAAEGSVAAFFKQLQHELVVVEDEQKMQLYIQMWNLLQQGVRQRWIIIDYIPELYEWLHEPAFLSERYEDSAIPTVVPLKEGTERYFSLGRIDMEQRKIAIGQQEGLVLEGDQGIHDAELWYLLREQLCSYEDLSEMLSEETTDLRHGLDKLAGAKLLFAWDKSIMMSDRLPVSLVPQGYIESRTASNSWIINHSGSQVEISEIEHMYWAYSHPLLTIRQVYERLLLDTGYDADELAGHMLAHIPDLINEGERLLYIDEALCYERSYAELLAENEMLKRELDKLLPEQLAGDK
ncbi:hypothetical protein [Paenibacillus odorifer]|uniref:Uncharacterized protein n=1 Tax=Paenibacillus odorifer TaxID=189426 RepID=A0A1R0Y9L9_9BACL|nr:hypothetical protein [Paenibacillus odorifer]OMD44057.1 hypothetical protein BSK52_00460 [Paenibacillus odorifer]